MKVCAEPGCPAIQPEPRCTTHTRQRDRARGTRQQRGYGNDHDQLRRLWQPRVDAGRVDCHAIDCLEPTRRIIPGTRWDLGHTPDRRSWTGPEHARCNRAAGGRAAHPTR